MAALAAGWVALAIRFAMLMPTPTCVWGPVLAGKIHAIGSCLKLYLRELEDPVLTHAQYDRWIAIGRSGTGDDDTDEGVIEQCRELVRLLPYECRRRHS